jgi:tetratricopeptide (TPR) repeat protein
MSLLHSGNNDKETFRKALDAARRALELSQSDRMNRERGGRWLAIAIAQYKLGEVDEAIRSLRNGLDAIPQDLSDSLAPRLEMEVTLATYLEAEGDVAAAEEVYRDGIAFRKGALPEVHPLIATAEARLAAFLREQMQHDEAESLLLAAERNLRDNPEAADANRAYVTEQLVALYNAWGKPDEVARWTTDK